ncbi:hypothetical protein CLAFUW4_09990, partial [Fulvia fulva]
YVFTLTKLLKEVKDIIEKYTELKDVIKSIFRGLNKKKKVSVLRSGF